MSYETAAHRFTNLATRHLDLPVHFMRISSAGVIYKAYENDGVQFPMDATGAIEGQRVCRYWTARVVFDRPDLSSAYQQYTDTKSGTYWCTAVVDRTSPATFSVSVGVPYADVKWMRGPGDHRAVQVPLPGPGLLRAAAGRAGRPVGGQAWPSARVHSHLLAAMPPGVFPGVDQTEVLDVPGAALGGLSRAVRPHIRFSPRRGDDHHCHLADAVIVNRARCASPPLPGGRRDPAADSATSAIEQLSGVDRMSKPRRANHGHRSSVRDERAGVMV